MRKGIIAFKGDEGFFLYKWRGREQQYNTASQYNNKPPVKSHGYKPWKLKI
jgi:hypothetical protein